MSAGVRTLSTVALLAWLAAAIPAAAQDVSLPTAAPPPANLAYVEGGVDLIHEGAADRAVAGTLLSDGDLVRTLNGRAEIVFADGTLLHLDYDTELELLSPVRLRLSGGRVSLRVSPSATPYVIDTHAAAVRLDPRGEYGLTADGRLSRLEVTVARGVAEIDDGGVRTLVRGGELASILGAGGRVLLQQFNSARWDAFERWANERANGFSTTASARQLPYELRPYGGMLDSYGRWDYVAPYGNVWFPAVAASWRPYYTGEWRRTRYGWTWSGHDPWSWPTHHYGRWGFTGASWYWIPARVWGPAWVSWSFTPGFVSWCPLGFDGRAVIGYSHVSSWLRGGRDHPDYRPHYDPWRAWTVMPRDHFDGRRPVRTHAIDPTRLPEHTRRAMVDTAVARDSLPAPAAAAETRVPTRGFIEPRGAVRSPNAIPVPSPSAAARPEFPASAGETSSKRPESPSREGGPSTFYPPRVYDRGSAVERRSETRQEDRTDAPRVYTPPAYAVPRSESPRSESPRPERQERAEAPPPRPASRGDEGRSSGSSGRRVEDPGGRVRSPSAAPRESGEGRSAAPPARRSGGSEGQSQGNNGSGGGGAVRRRP
jgi:hypothetical protein